MALESGNLYIPKFILDVPWYYKPATNAQQNPSNEPVDTLAHHRKHPGTTRVDYSEPRAGTGISDRTLVINGTKTRLVDDYDGKRDRWHGHTAQEWDEILEKWESIKKRSKSNPSNVQNEDSDDTDYELELEELGLDRSVLKLGHIEDPMEKMIRDRRDVPRYILAINSNQGGKIRLGTDSTVGLTADDSDFVKESQDVKEFKKMQKFAWEQNQEFESKQQREHYHAQVAGLNDPNAVIPEKPAADLDSSMEASPTLMMLKNREKEAEKKRAGDEKRRKLMQMYG